MAFELPPLPYSTNALAAEGMCQETLELHHGKHHQAYVTALNGFVEKNPDLQGKTLEEIIAFSNGKADIAPVFNNAGQHWNHILFWKNLSPKGGKLPGKLEAKIVADFGSVATFKEQFKTAATTQFGSGWAWLVQGKDGKLKTTKTPNGSNPLATGEGTVLLGLDVWEHSYYLDFRNRRPDYVSNYLDKLANYEFAEALLGRATRRGGSPPRPSPNKTGGYLTGAAFFVAKISYLVLVSFATFGTTTLAIVSRSTITFTPGAISTSISRESSAGGLLTTPTMPPPVITLSLRLRLPSIAFISFCFCCCGRISRK